VRIHGYYIPNTVPTFFASKNQWLKSGLAKNTTARLSPIGDTQTAVFDENVLPNAVKTPVVAWRHLN